MRNLEMTYYNVYYYCNIIENLSIYFTSDIEWLATGTQFTEPFFEEEPEDFPKHSVLHLFIEFVIRQVVLEETSEALEELQCVFDELNDETRAVRLQKTFKYKENKNLSLPVDNLLIGCGTNNYSFYNYLLDNEVDDFAYALIEYVDLDADISNAIEQVAKEVFYLLFQNRDFLFRFNSYLSGSNPYQIKRCAIPIWAKRAVVFRDHGKCVFCDKDLSGLFDIIDQNAIHFDHIVSLKNGGLNDVSNLQLTCQECNLRKKHSSQTSIKYKDWYDQ